MTTVTIVGAGAAPAFQSSLPTQETTFESATQSCATPSHSARTAIVGLSLMVSFLTILLLAILAVWIKRRFVARKNQQNSVDHALENLARGGKPSSKGRGEQWFGQDVESGPEAAPRNMSYNVS